MRAERARFLSEGGESEARIEAKFLAEELSG